MQKYIILCSRDLDYGIGTQCRYALKQYDEDDDIKKVYFIGPRNADGFSPKVTSEVIPVSGRYFVTREPFFAYQSNRIIKQLILRNRIDEIVLHTPVMAENYGVNLEVTFHTLHKSIIQNFPKTPSYLIASLFHHIFSYFDKKTIHHADAVHFVSSKILNDAMIYYPAYAKKFSIKANTIDKNLFFALSKTEIEKVKKRMDLADSKKNILYVGRLEPFKGILDLIEIIIQLKDPSIRLLVVGDGPLAQHIQRYPFVRYFGRRDHNQLFEYYNIADVFIFPSRNESCGLALMEAIQCKTPSIAFKPDGKNYLTVSDRIITHGVNGFLVRDKQEMMETILLILRSGFHPLPANSKHRP